MTHRKQNRDEAREMDTYFHTLKPREESIEWQRPDFKYCNNNPSETVHTYTRVPYTV